ncbi:eukaryotic aspartyl protease superfamily protein [Acanthamoeba castellanii str. Neff]|uniref:Eukaryotic aspartyl protease superfamily protein n=1 Tax=Acanthamoeba castellanii (strain ATCC 30010 / Neff) TaxID=1257118 RepID=L8HDH9_ACACF|nr:eukaryotic aspartyl protease superfamily protein [Acanthamoeba castellanii str. Neff]ELR22451.1 eukaryotic aspartyl protease superfamily protein [Acanthamoeba castellanii str. Neff]
MVLALLHAEEKDPGGPPPLVVQLERRPPPRAATAVNAETVRRVARRFSSTASAAAPTPVPADALFAIEEASGAHDDDDQEVLSAPLHHNAAEYFVEVAIADGNGHDLPRAVDAAGGGDADGDDVGSGEQQQQQQQQPEVEEERGSKVGRQRGAGYFLLHVDTGSACGGGCHGALCGFEMAYADRSRIAGVLVRDRVHMAGVEWAATFGAIVDAHRFCVRGVDGILGLARPGTATNPLNCVPNCVEPPLDSLMREHPMPDVFALQLRDTGGRLIVGSADDGVTALREPVAWSADLGAHAGHYRIALRTIAVLDAPPAGPRLVRLPGRGRATAEALLDSGTSVIAASSPLYAAIVAAFLAGNCTTRGICAHARTHYTHTRDQHHIRESGEHVFQYCFPRDSFPIDRYPALSLGLAHGVTLTLRPRQYLLERLADDGTTVMVCSAIRETKASHASLVLGAPFFRAFHTVFDRGNGRIGFAEHADGEGGAVEVDPDYREPAPDLALYTSWENGAGVWVGLALVGALVSVCGGVLVCLYARPPVDRARPRARARGRAT